MVLLNVLRIVMLAAILIVLPGAFEIMHQYVWQIAMVMAVLGMSIAWMSRETKPRLVARGR